MPKRTIADRLAAALTANGWVEVEVASRKYRKFKNDDVVKDRFYFLGKAGSFRFGRIFTESHPADRLKAKLLLSQDT